MYPSSLCFCAALELASGQSIRFNYFAATITALFSAVNWIDHVTIQIVN